MKRSPILFIGLLLNLQTWAQSELTLPTLDHLIESDRYNPALSDHSDGFYFGFPSGVYEAFHTGPGYRDLIDEQNGVPILNINRLAEDLVGDNQLVSAFRLQTFKLMLCTGNWVFGLEHEIVYEGQITYPDELVQLYVNGNQPWIGQSVDIGPNTRIYSYNNYAIPIAYHSRRFSLGLRPRLLVGNQFGQTPSTRATLHTSDEFYQLTLTTDYVFQNVGIIDFEDANLLNYEIDNLRHWSLLSGNLGLGVDAGLKWAVSDRAAWAISISDFAFLQWKDVKTHTSNRVTEYAGIEVIELFEIGQVDLQQAIDSLDAIFDVQSDRGSVRFDLPLRWQSHFTYQLNDQWQLSTSFTYQSKLQRPWNIGVVITGELKTHWFVGTTVANRFGELATGLHSSLKWGRFNGFLIVDQLLKGLNPLRANHFSVRGGLNFAF